MTLAYPQECDSKRIEAVSVYRPKLAVYRKIRLYHFFFLAMYLFMGYQVLSTIGEPYRRFLEKADREGFQVMEGSTKLRAEMEYSLQDINDPNRRTKKIGWTEWADMDIEELAAEKKKDKERNVLDSLPKHLRVPNKYAPAFWPSLVTGILVTLHALVMLMQVWSVGFRVSVNFAEVSLEGWQLPESLLEFDEEEEPTKDAAVATTGVAASSPNAQHDVPDRRILHPPNHLPTHARIVPAKEGERHVLVPLEYYPVLGMTFEYHRRRYIYQTSDDNDDGVGTWSKIRCRTDIPLHILRSWQGFPDGRAVATGQVRYGPNLFSVKQPTFGELYKAQLLNPFSVFQIFCVLLWAIDDYLIYSFFSLFMVLMFEGTVVFQRLKSLQALRGMGNPRRPVLVHRNGRWTTTETTSLLPGDIMSLTRVKPHLAKSDDDTKQKLAPRKIEDEGGDIAPADLLLLRGSTVVNEASLTGESIPQMKEGLGESANGGEEKGDGENSTVSMKGANKMNVVYAGTKMLQCKGQVGSEPTKQSSLPYGHIPPPPDGGAVCFVLRTGFASAQGKLVRMIEGSQEKVKGHERETGLLLLLLCCFAVISSSYVLYHGAQDEKRSKYELLLHCILIVTSVIRPELPMQMALAVNNSLMTLMKMHVFCTEPYRVPTAGKLDACLFDKTGTLTTDELVAVGVYTAPTLKSFNKTKEINEAELLTPMMKVSDEAALVLAGCHSLVVIDGETTGDPLESAALNSMRWHLDLSTGRAGPKPATEKKSAGHSIRLSSGQQITEVEVLTRHHFSSTLSRMSCVVRGGPNKYSVAKGSPEAIGSLLTSKPDGYDDTSKYLAKQGYRVIALASKQLSSEADVTRAVETRSECESELEFSGFIAFTCMVRKDTAGVLRKLKEGGMSIAMVTGDALLTAIHVAKEVEICEPIGGCTESNDEPEEKNEELKALLESKRGAPRKKTKEEKPRKEFKPIAYLDLNAKGQLSWLSYEDDSKVDDFVANQVPVLAQQYDLATTGKCLAAAYEADEGTTKVLAHIKVFARMTPDAKETVIECLHSIGALCLMCGDGANDVGALKQADVGVALLSGFGNLNVDKADCEEKTEKKKEDESDSPRAIMSKEHLEAIRRMPVALIKMKIKQLGADPAKYPELVEKEDLVKLYQIKAREVAVKKHDKKNEVDKAKMSKVELAAERRKEMAEKQRRMQERAAELEAQGVQWATFKAMQEFYGNEMNEAKKKKAAIVQSRGIEGSAATLAAQFGGDMEDIGDQLMVKLGDASIAAPFTSKMPSIRSCEDIVRQGRCTLVNSIQMYQIMALQCLISSYSLSVLYLAGVKYGDSQMTAMGLLGSVSFMSVSRSKPLDKLSKVRPLNSIFHPALFTSLLGQFSIHLATMLLSVHYAKQHLEEDFDADLDGTFKPGILNTVVFLISSVQQVTVFVVNLQGRPFMTGVTENTPLLWSLIATFILTFMFASETVPGLNRYFQLVPFPDEVFRDLLLMLLTIDLVACFVFDRLMKFFFSREILYASFEGTTSKDLFTLLRAFGMVGLLMYTFLGNSDQWDELIEMEKNMTADVEASEDVAESVAECVGDMCQAVADTVNETVQAIRDEF